MKYIILFFPLFISCRNKIINCSKIKNGSFSTVDVDGIKTDITRLDNLQTENYNNGERISTFEVVWTSECEYLLCNKKLIYGENPYSEYDMDTLKISIIYINDNYYEGNAELIGREFQMPVKVNIEK